MLQNVRLHHAPPPLPAGNAPAGMGRQPQFLLDGTRRYVEQMAPYATDFFAAEVQGLETDPDAWAWYEIRAASAFHHSRESASDDWRNICFRRQDITHIPLGTKFRFGNQVWLTVNPSNLSGGVATALVRRCNVVWNSLDFFGNVISEPFVLEHPATHGNANTVTEYGRLADADVNGIMQANTWTRTHLRENTRIALGSGVYAVRGLSDFIRAFTAQPDSVPLLYFSLAYQQPLETDDMERGIADGLAFRWEIHAEAQQTAVPGTQFSIIPQSVRCGSPVESPVCYLWHSQFPEIASVDDNGLVTALAEGQAVIRCALQNNPTIYTDVCCTVSQAPGLAWTSAPPARLPQFTQAVLRTTVPVRWEVSGGAAKTYDYTEAPTQLSIRCYAPATQPLTVTASAGQVCLTTQIRLTER